MSVKVIMSMKRNEEKVRARLDPDTFARDESVALSAGKDLALAEGTSGSTESDTGEGRATDPSEHDPTQDDRRRLTRHHEGRSRQGCRQIR